MKTISDVCREYPDFSLIIKAVVRRIGKESIEDVNNHGIDGGYGGFIYTWETVAFWKEYKKLILEMLKNDANDQGIEVIEMIQSFNCLQELHGKNGWDSQYNLRNHPVMLPSYTADEIGRALYGNFDSEQDTIYNALAWYAAETVCRYFEE